MNRQDFEACLERLTPKQREILWLFLDCPGDEAIAKRLVCTTANVRAHLANICKTFGYTNGEGESYSYRQDVVQDFIQHYPDRVSPQWHERLTFTQAQPEPPDFPGRPLKVNSPFYLERPYAEDKALKVLNPGALVRIRGPRKTGKTSLLNRTLHSAKDQGCHTVAVKLYRAGDDILQDVESFLRWFCLEISDGVELPPNLDNYWNDQRGYASSCSEYLQRHVLGQLTQPLVVGLDEADCLFEYPKTAKAFFKLVRGWSEEGKTSELWQNFRQVVVYATEVYIDFDIHASPFNVGTPIKLLPFKPAQIQTLAQRYGLGGFTQSESEALIALVGGHPHLVQLALYHLHQSPQLSLKASIADATSQTGLYGDHLRTLADTLSQHPPLAEAFNTAIATSGQPVTLNPKVAKQLEGMGLVTRNDVAVQISCQLYQRYFQTHPPI
jgi:serine/threonine-protein kinase